jgi:two-component SAPR family response regulator
LSAGNRDFKVALNAMHKAIEPHRQPRAQPKFIRRNELVYWLELENIWIDAIVFEANIEEANRVVLFDMDAVITHYKKAIDLYQGEFLPERRYEDWTSAERERLNMLALGSMIALAELLTTRNPLESIRLTLRVLTIDPTWKDAYRIQMKAYMAQCNHPKVIHTYEKCVENLNNLYLLEPLSETQNLHHAIMEAASLTLVPIENICNRDATL